MAKRKRLTPAQPDYLQDPAPVSAAASPRPAPGPLPAAPIAQVAGEAAASAALAELSQEMEAARAEGRLIASLPLDAIDAGYLVRDRLVQDEDEMQALIASLMSRGQQTPIEVIALPEPKDGRTYGLVSGWRRLTALRRLHKAGQDPRYEQVRARIIAPDSRQAAYVAMVEENEIRANLSHYERARIALRAYHEQVYPTQKAALQGLFDSVSRSKRSKIGSFIPLVEALDRVLKFPTAIPEKLGLELSRAVQEDRSFKSRLFARLLDPPSQNAAEELGRITTALAARRGGRQGKPADKAASSSRETAPAPRETAPAPQDAAVRGGPVQVRFEQDVGRILLSGAGVDAAFHADLQAWLAARG